MQNPHLLWGFCICMLGQKEMKKTVLMESHVKRYRSQACRSQFIYFNKFIVN